MWGTHLIISLTPREQVGPLVGVVLQESSLDPSHLESWWEVSHTETRHIGFKAMHVGG